MLIVVWQVLKSLNHPNIIRCYETFETADSINIVLEYADQGDLEDAIKARFPFLFMGKLEDLERSFDVLGGGCEIHGGSRHARRSFRARLE